MCDFRCANDGSTAKHVNFECIAYMTSQKLVYSYMISINHVRLTLEHPPDNAAKPPLLLITPPLDDACEEAKVVVGVVD